MSRPYLSTKHKQKTKNAYGRDVAHNEHTFSLLVWAIVPTVYDVVLNDACQTVHYVSRNLGEKRNSLDWKMRKILLMYLNIEPGSTAFYFTMMNLHYGG